MAILCLRLKLSPNYAVVPRDMKFLRLCVVLLSVILLPSLHATITPDGKSPAKVVKELYQTSLDHFSGFTADSVKLVQPWVAPELYDRMWKKVNAPEPKDAAPEIEGDLFLGCQEPPTKFKVEKTSINIDQAKATVQLALFFAGETREYKVLLEQVNGSWKVCDVNYGKDGKLTDLLSSSP